MDLSLQQEMLVTERVLDDATRDLQVEGRLSLPATSPPIASIRSCRARIRELRATAADGYARLEGLAEVELNYQTPGIEAERPAVQEYLAAWTEENGGALAFTQEISLLGARPGMKAAAEAVVANVHTDLLDAGTVKCQLTLEIRTAVSQEEKAVVVSEILASPPESLGVVKELLQLEKEVGKAETQAVIHTVLTLPEIKDDMARIIARNARVSGVAAELVRGRAIVSGRLEIDLVYVSRNEDGGEAIEVCEWGGEGRTPIGFEAFLDLPGVGPEAEVEADGHLGRLDLEAIGPREAKLDATVLVAIHALARQHVPVVVEVVPGPEEVADIRWIQVECRNLLGQAGREIEFETTLEIPPSKPGAERILQAVVCPSGMSVQAAEGKCLVDGWLDVDLLYLAEAQDGGMPLLTAIGWRRSQGTGLPLADLIELAESRAELAASLTWRLGRYEVELLNPRALRLTASITVKAKVGEVKLISAVADAAVVPLAPLPGRPSMLFYVMQPGDSLWSVARRYTTTVEAVARTNKIADPAAVQTGAKLLIPRSPAAV